MLAATPCTIAAPRARAPLTVRAATIGTASGRPRYYAQGKYLARAGFQPGSFLRLTMVGEGETAALEVSVATEPTGNRVSAKAVGRRGDEAADRVPVIDLTSSMLRELFGEGGSVHVRVEAGRLLLSRPLLDRRIAARLRDGSEGSVFSGGGLMTEAARMAGFTPRFAVEIDERYADIYEANHPTATMYRMSAHEAAFASLPRVELLTMGIPCEPWSMATRQAKGTGGQKRDHSLPATAHPLGDMALWAFSIIARVNPRTIVIEEAPAFAASETAYLLRGALERLGYAVDCRVIDASECGYPTKRKRTVLVAQTPDAEGSRWSPWPVECEATRRVGDYLDRDVADSQWWDRTSKAWVFDHADRQRAKGNGFAFQTIDPDAPAVGALKKRMLAGQGDSPVVASPTEPDTYRWLTLSEMRRFHGVPERYDLGDAVTTAGEVVGQGVHVELFADIIARATGRTATPIAAAVAEVAPPETAQTARSGEGEAVKAPQAPALPQLALFE